MLMLYFWRQHASEIFTDEDRAFTTLNAIRRRLSRLTRSVFLNSGIVATCCFMTGPSYWRLLPDRTAGNAAIVVAAPLGPCT